MSLGPADYEEQTVLKVLLMAQTLTSHEAEAVLEIVITEVNDNAPVITINTLSSSDEEEAVVMAGAEPGTFVADVSVYDADNGVDGEFSCDLDNNHFKLIQLQDTEFKIVITAVIQHDYMLNIRCEDKGENPLATTKQLAIKHSQ